MPAIAVVVGNMVGTGVFTTLGYQLVEIQSGFVLMALWALGGICALCGAVCFGELAAAHNFGARAACAPCRRSEASPGVWVCLLR